MLLLIGFVLSDQAENFSFQAYQVTMSKFRFGTDVGLEYLFSPIVIVLAIVIVISIVVGVRQSKAVMSAGDVPTGGKRAPLVFLLLMTAYFVASFIDAYAIRIQTDRIFPLTISLVSIIACVLLLVKMMRAPESDPVFADGEAGGEDADAAHGLWATLAWFAALLILSSLLGFILALVLFLVAFLRVRAGCSWAKTLILSACGIGFMCFMAGMLNRDCPPGLFQEFVRLPWPLT